MEAVKLPLIDVLLEISNQKMSVLQGLLSCEKLAQQVLGEFRYALLVPLQHWYEAWESTGNVVHSVIASYPADCSFMYPTKGTVTCFTRMQVIEQLWDEIHYMDNVIAAGVTGDISWHEIFVNNVTLSHEWLNEVTQIKSTRPR